MRFSAFTLAAFSLLATHVSAQTEPVYHCDISKPARLDIAAAVPSLWESAELASKEPLAPALCDFLVSNM
ncbi:hypothetical protein NP233_g6291 [Leucocoprinus birnbaumii]|uniref:Uncharacterized protein n=1 Tax=Leucocoprinus birnbaumii TaxID=56174 RepID=A0AAD5YVN6_9AGAR|nr:hypothetical protein NP233_g6291 [Leucocoprinus birnbaumii]